jgi:hypothetical protein
MLFKKIQWLCVSIIGICGALLALENTYGIELSATMSWYIEHALVASTVGGGIAKLTVENGYKG